MGILTAIVGRYIDAEKSGSPVQFDRQRCSAIIGQCGLPCVQACPHDAICPDEAYVDHRKCARCGCCTSRCPNGAISLAGYPDLEMVGDIVHAAMGKYILRFYCEQNPSGRLNAQLQSLLGEIKVRCLARFYAGLSVYALTTGIKGIWVDTSGCAGCHDNQDGRVLEQIEFQIDQAQQIIGCLGREGKTIYIGIHPPAELLAGITTDNNLNRRDFFTYIRKEIRDYSRKFVDDLLGSDSPDKNSSKKAGHSGPDKKPPLSRLILLAAVRNISQEQAVCEDFPGLTMIGVGKECSLCGICSSCCPTGALRQEKLESGMKGELFFRPAYCIDCGICRRKCPNDVISYKDRTEFAVFRNGLETRVFAAELSLCKKCKAPYVQHLGENGLCDICSHKSSVY